MFHSPSLEEPALFVFDLVDYPEGRPLFLEITTTSKTSCTVTRTVLMMTSIQSSSDAINGKPNTLLLRFCAVVTYISIAISDGHYLPLAYPSHTQSRENSRNCLCYLLKHIVLCFYQFFLLCVIFVCAVIDMYYGYHKIN